MERLEYRGRATTQRHYFRRTQKQTDRDFEGRRRRNRRWRAFFGQTHLDMNRLRLRLVIGGPDEECILDGFMEPCVCGDNYGHVVGWLREHGFNGTGSAGRLKSRVYCGWERRAHFHSGCQLSFQEFGLGEPRWQDIKALATFLFSGASWREDEPSFSLALSSFP